MKPPKIFAHRGLSSLYPENSLIAFQKAIELGVDGVECDVHRTADGKLMVIHDGSIDRTTAGKGLVCMMTLDEIRRFNLLPPGGQEEYSDQKVPTFDEFLDTVAPSGTELRIEIKEVGYEEELAETIIKRRLEERTTFISFLPTAICSIKRQDQSMRTSLLTVRFAQVRYEHIRQCLNGVDFQFGPALSRDLYDQIRRDGLLLDLWTIDEPEALHRALEWEPDYITTNFPQRLMKELGRLG